MDGNHSIDECKRDIWDLGVTALEIFYGYPPISVFPKWKFTYMRIGHSSANYEKKKMEGGHKGLTKDFKNFVIDCLQKDPSRRPSAQQLKKYGFFKKRKLDRFFTKLRMQEADGCVDFLMENQALNSDSNGESEPMHDGKWISGWTFNARTMLFDPVYKPKSSTKKGKAVIASNSNLMKTKEVIRSGTQSEVLEGGEGSQSGIVVQDQTFKSEKQSVDPTSSHHLIPLFGASQELRSNLKNFLSNLEQILSSLDNQFHEVDLTKRKTDEEEKEQLLKVETLLKVEQKTLNKSIYNVQKQITTWKSHQKGLGGEGGSANEPRRDNRLIEDGTVAELSGDNG